MHEKAVRIRVDEEVVLEGGYREVSGPAKGAALVLHPHPLYGGSMHNNVVEALMEAAMAAGWNALRFNFRGVGRSSGRHDQGRGEQDDVLAAGRWLRQEGHRRLALLGYSFGSLVGARAADRLEGLSCGVWVSPPLILGDLPPWPQYAGPLLVLVGGADEFTSVEGLEAYVQEQGTRASLFTLSEADHFWWGGESVLIEEVRVFLSAVAADDK